MTIARLSHFGPEIHFDIKPVTVPTKVSRRPLMLMGVAKYIVDILDSDGDLVSDAMLTGPATVTSGAQATAAWVACVTPTPKAISITLNGIPKVLSPAGTPTTAAQVATILTTAFAPDAATGFEGVTFSIIGTGASLYLVATSIPVGDAVDMIIETETHDAYFFAAAGGSQMEGRYVYGFGNYLGYDVTVPFASVPDPDGILDMCVLDSTFAATLAVSVDRGDRVVSMSRTAAWERNAHQREPVIWAVAGKGAPASFTDLANHVNLSTYAPFTHIAADATRGAPPILHPWTPVGGTTSRFWAPGEDASVIIPGATSAGYVTLTVTKNLDPAKLALVPSGSSELNDCHGALGHIYVVVVGGQLGETVVWNDVARSLTINLVPIAPTCANVAAAVTTAAADSAHAIYGMFTAVATVGATLVDLTPGPIGALAANTFLWGGMEPIQFDDTKGTCVLAGNKLFASTAVVLAGAVQLQISVDGSAVEEFEWPLGTAISAIISAFNTRFGSAAVMSALNVGYGGVAPIVVKITGVAKGRSGTIYIPYAVGLEHLMVTESFTVPTAQFVVDLNEEHALYTPAASSHVGLIFPGGSVVSDIGTHTIRFLRDVAVGAFSVHFDTPAAVAAAVTYTINTGVFATDYVGIKHYGIPYPELASDELWMGDAYQATITGYQGIVSDGGVDFGNRGLTFSANFSTSDTFEAFYTRIKNITSTLIGDTKPTPDLIVSTADDTMYIRNEAVMNDTGQSYTGISLPMYCGFEAVRLDITADYLSRGLTFTTVDDILEYGPIDPRNELIFGAWMAYQGMQLATSYIPFKVIGIGGDTLTDWSAATKILEKDVFWMPIALTDDRAINTWLANYIIASEAPTRKKDWRTIIYTDTPDEEFPTTIGTGLTAATNVTGAQRTIVIMLSKLNVAAALITAGYVPSAVTDADGLYVMLSGGGATETQATYKWLIQSVNSATNTVVVVDTPTDTFYESDDPPEITNANITIYVRGDAITTADDKGTALQAFGGIFANARVCVCPNGGVDAPDYNGTLTRLAGYFGLATLAGYIQTHKIENPVSGWTIPHLTHVYETDELYDEIDSIMGLFFFVNDHDAGTVEVGMDFTTDSSAVKLHRFTVGCQLDALAIRIRDSVSSWKKMSISQRTLNTLYAQVHSAGDAAMQEREISRFDLDTIELGAPDFSEGGDPNQTVTDIEAVTIYGSAETFIPVGKLFIYITV